MSTNNALLGIIAAAVAGTVIGLLIAPEDGQETRKKIKKKTNSLASDLIDALERSKDQAAEKVQDLKAQGKAYKDTAVDKAEEYKEAAQDEINKY
ncbi:YtxH domain-containing protein [Dyadobacter sandarakinus]|uniref:YtxH domain-containing protein n=1 Tax=Dyadobacter sandarakinus TaxID=2747268 RepID=A0ABX7ID32_9BACT|nr:YtxH domain-containing protein [Dyadobacter sandarakinus]QRR03715.1 YtxH domain-containing protein [Dyadobacter sandarakinus]